LGTRRIVGGTLMLARVAESLYWMARAIERADTYSRLLEVSHAMNLERGGSNGNGATAVWEPLVEITGDLETFLANHRRADERSVSWFLSFSPVNPNSIISCVRRARRNAHTVRDLLPTEVWESVNSAYLELSSWPAGRITREGVYPFCRLVRRQSHLVQGLIDQAMRHDGSWHFLRLGRYLERAEKTARLLEVKYHIMPPGDPRILAPAELHQWRSLLRSVGADEAYLQTDAIVGSPRAMARFLISDPLFPRSVAYCLAQVAASIDALVTAGVMLPGAPPVEVISNARHALMNNGRLPWNRALATLLDDVQKECNVVGQAIAEAVFAYPYGDDEDGSQQHAQASRQSQN
jgi:uncharacterized alpha-E superfamily protein